MSIITISRGSYSKGKEIAEKVAEKLNYECISRDILIEASEHFNISKVKLIRAIHDAPSVLNRFTHGKERYIAHIREALLKHVEKDNVVYHGLAGHFFLQGVPHVLKIRITADLNERVRNEAERENITHDEARKILVKDDQERRNWAITLYGLDPWDSRIYDMTIHIGCITVDDAVNLILQTVKLPCFQRTDESQRKLQDLLLAASVQAALPNGKVLVKDGVVIVNVEAPLIHEKRVAGEITQKIDKIQGVKEVRVNVMPIFESD